MNRFDPPADFERRHDGVHEERAAMLEVVGRPSMAALIDAAIPSNIRMDGHLDLPAPKSERQALDDLAAMMDKNQVWQSHIGLGYADTITPGVIQRNILENPGWYTQYTPYQAEISQGRLEALLNFQHMVCDLTGLEVANASMLDEATAAAEAMTLLRRVGRKIKSQRFFVADTCHPQTIDVVKTRATPLGIEVVVGDCANFDFSDEVFGVLVQYPDTFGKVRDYRAFIDKAHSAGALVAMACDLLALCMLRPPGALGADCAFGNAQRFGVPLGFGGPHAAFFATKTAYQRQMPGRLVGVSKDSRGKPALRLALQTREQHIRREKATSNICTAQVLLAIMSSMYAVYHGPRGLRAIAERVHAATSTLAQALDSMGLARRDEHFFDTITIDTSSKAAIVDACAKRRINLRVDHDGLGVTIDETITESRLRALIDAFAEGTKKSASLPTPRVHIPADLLRGTDFLNHPVFHRYHTETEMLRYIKRLESRDLSLTSSMIPLGSCTMKLNATSEMVPLAWAKVSNIHPFVPANQVLGYHEFFRSFEKQLAEITGFHAVSLQPNAGSQGEYTGLLTIRAYHQSRGQAHRNICLIPQSAHGTNPASAVMAGMRVIVVRCDDHGNIDLTDLQRKAEDNKDNLAAFMVTYPSTHGVFESQIAKMCETIHNCGGQVYLDGANLNAQVGYCRPGDYGGDVCHLNLHKTFAIPHGGGGPGMGPIAVAEHLAPFLPGHCLVENVGGSAGRGAVSAAPFGSASILPISWMYIEMLGAAGLEAATQGALLNANYMAARLREHYPVLYTGETGLCAHEFIIACQELKEHGVSVEDVAKRLSDYGFHAPTMSFPVVGTLMIEPTESESKAELDRLCDALIDIRREVARIAAGDWPKDDNPLKNAPHTADMLAGAWSHPYSREEAVYPSTWTRENKFWPAVGRVDNVFGDRNLVCSCPPPTAYEEA